MVLETRGLRLDAGNLKRSCRCIAPVARKLVALRIVYPQVLYFRCEAFFYEYAFGIAYDSPGTVLPDAAADVFLVGNVFNGLNDGYLLSAGVFQDDVVFTLFFGGRGW